MAKKLLFFLLLPLHLLWSGGIELSELGTPGLGLAGVGQAALAGDASTAYYNPAGMALLCGNQYVLGLQTLTTDVRFEKKFDTTFAGGTGGEAGATLPGLGFYLANHFNDCVTFGFSLNSPYGASFDYSRHWAGRYLDQSVLMASLAANPSVAIKITPSLYIGGGFTVQYSRLWMALAINPTVFGGSLGDPDGRLELDLDDWETGFNLGGVAIFSSKTRLGVAYRSSIRHNYRGSGTLTPKGTSFGVDTDFHFPQSVTVALYHDLHPCITLLVDGAWFNYKEFDGQTITSDDGGEVVIPRKMSDIWHIGIACQLHATHWLTFQAGYAHDQSPQKARFRTPELPLDRQNRYGVGVLYTHDTCTTLGMAFEYVNFGRAPIDNRVLRGHYKANNGYFFNLTLNRAF